MLSGETYKDFLQTISFLSIAGSAILVTVCALNDNYFSKRLSEAVVKKAELVVEHKADLNYIVVGAASVIAKVIRDRAVNHLISEIGIDFGSGYMSDPKTQEFLEKYHDKFPHLFRKKWQSYKNAEVKKMQKSLGEF